MSSSLTLATNFQIMEKEYRKNVGAVIIKNKSFWTGKRSDIDDDNGGWQFPQGGVEENEDSDEAIYREIFEETGIKKEKLKLIAKFPESIKYDFPENVVKKSVGTKWEKWRGQEQFWYFFDFLGQDNDVNLNITNQQEFKKWEWKDENFIVNNIVEFKKNTYLKLFDFLKKKKLIV